jgi:importin-7
LATTCPGRTTSSGRCGFQVCELLNFFTHFNKPISPRLWGMWPILQHIAITPGQDDYESMVGPFDNFVCHGTDVFISSESPNYRTGLWLMLEHCLKSDLDDFDVKPIAKLMDVVLLNCKGRVDEWVWPYLELALSRLVRVKGPSFATLLMNVVPAALVYDAQLTLSALEAHGKTQQVQRPVRAALPMLWMPLSGAWLEAQLAPKNGCYSV